MQNRILSLARVASVLFLLLSFTAQAQTIYYVNAATGDDANPGTSWAVPYRNLTKALAQANVSTAAQVQVWVAAGVYTPLDGLSALPADTRDTSFLFFRGDGVGHGLKVYGGFAGTETAVGQRDTLHRTYLDGDLGGGNAYHVGVIAGQSAASDSIVIDGFTIRNGGAAGLGSKVINSVVVDRNTGGGLSLNSNIDANKMAIRNCRMENNWAAYLFASTFYSVTGQGAGMAIRTSNAYLENCRFTNNTINGLGAGGAAAFLEYANVTLKGVDLTANTVVGGTGTSFAPSGEADGGALMVRYSVLNVSNSSFVKNSCKGGLTYSFSSYGASGAYGGAIFFSYSVCNLSNTTFTGNRATGGDGGSFTYSGIASGGAINCANTRLTISSCSFNADTCSAGYSPNPTYWSTQATGGAVGCGSYPGDSAVVINNTSFSGNMVSGGGSAFTRGGALYLETTATIAGCQFNNNICTSDGGTAEGGALFSGERLINIKKSSFTGNYSTSGTVGDGGAITAQRSTEMIDSCNFTANWSQYGGAIYMQDNYLKLTNNTFNANHAANGGSVNFAILSTAGLSYVPHSFAANNVFTANVADNAGGAMYMDMVTTGVDTMLNNVFVANRAATDGGALCLSSSNHFIANNTFYKDTAAVNGGAVKTTGTGGIFKFANNIFYSNVGSGLTPDTCLRTLGGFYGSFSNAYSGTDPLFVNAANPVGADGIWATADDGLRLQMCSPAVNTGNTSLITPFTLLDIAGGIRLSGSAVDKGAYETALTPAVAGADSMCIGSTLTFTDATTGGTWATSNAAVATVNTSGVVTALVAGVARIRYIVNYGCVTDTAYRVVTVQGAPAVITATTDHVCVFNTITLSDATLGGTWHSSSTAIASVTAAGQVIGGSVGTVVITYTVHNACGDTSAVFPVYVENSTPSISGTDTVCAGAAVTLSIAAVSGAWSSASGLGLATISAGGVVTGLQQGTELFQYIGNNSCGSFTAYYAVNVHRPVDEIVAPAAICAGSTVSLNDSTTGGTWTSGSTGIVTVSGSSATGVASGTAIVTYAVHNACGSSSDTILIAVQSPVGAISGTSAFCVGSTVSLADAVSGGAWSVSPVSVATINTSGTVGAVAQGNATVTYTLVNVCGTTSANYFVTVYAPAAAITGADTVCPGAVTVLGNTTPGGTWSSSNTGIATVSGSTVGGVVSGVATITYSVSNACGATTATFNITVLPVSSCNIGVADLASANGLRIYPNPATSELYVVYDHAMTARLIDIDGRVVRTTLHAGSIDVRDLSDGIYLLEVLDENNQRIALERVVKTTK